jgi:hypothetical protein
VPDDMWTDLTFWRGVFAKGKQERWVGEQGVWVDVHGCAGRSVTCGSAGMLHSRCDAACLHAWHCRPGNFYQDTLGAYAVLDPSFWTSYHTFGLVRPGWSAALVPAAGLPACCCSCY